MYVSARKKLEPYHPNAPRNRPKASVSCFCLLPSPPCTIVTRVHQQRQGARLWSVFACIKTTLIVMGACAADKCGGQSAQAAPVHCVSPQPEIYFLKLCASEFFCMFHQSKRSSMTLGRACRHERYRGSSTIKFNDGDPDSFRPWKTTNQVPP